MLSLENSLRIDYIVCLSAILAWNDVSLKLYLNFAIIIQGLRNKTDNMQENVQILF